MYVLAAAVAVVGACSVTETALGSTAHVGVEGSDQVLYFDAAPGEANSVKVNEPTGQGLITVHDDAAITLEPGSGCSRHETGASYAVTCPRAGIDRIELRLGDGADRLQAVTVVGASLEVEAGAGDDEVHDGGSPGRLDGGADDDWLIVSAGHAASAHELVGGGGTDWVSYQSRQSDLSASLDDAANDGEPGEGDNVRADVEQVTAGFGNDELIGSGGPDDLNGSEGDDVVVGLGGDDRLDGWLGCEDDYLIGGDGDDRLMLQGATVAEGGPGNDTIEHSLSECDAIGNAAIGDEGDDTLIGAGGPDLLLGGTGADSITGAGGIDLADYSDHVAAVRVSIDDLPNDGATGEGDNVAGDVEDLLGGAGDDQLTGSDGDNVLAGGPGADRLEGGAGFDAVDYFDREAAVIADLTGDAFDDGEAGERDSIASDVEGIFGGLGDDGLTGNGSDGFLVGDAGDDDLSDPGGEDLLIGDAGRDAIWSRDGAADTVVCAEGLDSVWRDPIDALEDCEVIDYKPASVLPPSVPVPSVPLEPTDHLAPSASIAARRLVHVRTLSRRGLRIAVDCDEPCVVAARLVARTDGRPADRTGRASRRTVLAMGTLRKHDGRRRHVTLRVTARGRKTLRRARIRRLALTVALTDRAGNVRRLNRRLKTRR